MNRLNRKTPAIYMAGVLFMHKSLIMKSNFVRVFSLDVFHVYVPG